MIVKFKWFVLEASLEIWTIIPMVNISFIMEKKKEEEMIQFQGSNVYYAICKALLVRATSISVLSETHNQKMSFVFNASHPILLLILGVERERS